MTLNQKHIKKSDSSLLLQKFEVHQDFTKVFLDAFVLINAKQEILKFNSAFCQIVGLSARQVKETKLLNRILSIKVPNSRKNAILHFLTSNIPTRIDDLSTTNLVNQNKLSLIMSSYPYVEKGEQKNYLLGLCLLLRDVTAETNLQSKYKNKSMESILDPLTGLYTRRYFEAQIDTEIARAKANKENPKFALLMFDLDNFKIINDTYGHQAGDFILSETARVLKANSRSSDVIGRYGGEELLALIYVANARGVSIAAEKMRAAIQNHPYVFNGTKISVSTSIGVTLVTSQNDTQKDAVKRADKCLYQAKRTGKNKVVTDFK